MYKKYNPQLVKCYRSYSIDDLCKIYGSYRLNDKTIRNWIKHHGLVAFMHGKKFIIYGAVFREFLVRYRSKHTKGLKIHEFKCLNCQIIAPPLDSKIIELSLKVTQNIINAKAVCTFCDSDIQRYFKLMQYHEVLESYNILKNLCDCGINAPPIGEDSENNTKNKPKQQLDFMEDWR